MEMWKAASLGPGKSQKSSPPIQSCSNHCRYWNWRIFDGSNNKDKRNNLVSELILKSKTLTNLIIDTCMIDIHELLTTINTCDNIESVDLTYLRSNSTARQDFLTLLNPVDSKLPICNKIKGCRLYSLF